MANNCSNYIFISGEMNNVKNVLSFWQKELIDEYDKIEYLTDLSIYTEDEKNKRDVYGHVGTRWISGSNIQLFEDEAVIECISAWSPPLKLLKRIAELFDVKIMCDYEEPGCDVGGRYDCTKTSEYDDDLGYLAYIAKYDDERIVIELDDLVESSSLTSDIFDKVKPYLSEEDIDNYTKHVQP